MNKPFTIRAGTIALSLLLSAVLAAGIVLGYPLPATADIEGEEPGSNAATIAIAVEGSSIDIPSLTEGKDFTLGSAVQVDPAYFVDEEGNTPLAALIESKEAEGQAISWADETGAAFDWFSTPVNGSKTITGRFVDATYQVRVVFDDDQKTEDVVVDVAKGQSFADAYGKDLPTPTKKGYTFEGWVNAATDTDFDPSAAITQSCTVKAHYKLTDTAAVKPVDLTADIPKSLSGTCYIGRTWSVHPAQFSVSGFSGGLAGCSGTGSCTLPSAAAPSYTSARYSATLKSINIEAGLVYYSVHIVPPGAASPGGPRNSLGLIGYQTVGMTVAVHKNFGGYIHVTKTSANTEITDDNRCYPLAGAVFGIYNQKGEKVDELTTGEDGKTNKSNLLPAAEYTIKEEKAPTGYATMADQTCKVEPGKTTELSYGDQPQNNTIDLALQKFDRETEEQLPLGAATLKGAEYTFSYYDGYYQAPADANAQGQAKRTWTLATDEKGDIHFNNDYFVEGDDFYHDSEGVITLPLGTYCIKETKAPEGYNLNNEIIVVQVTTEGTAEHVETYQLPRSLDQVIRGDVSLIKVAEKTMHRLAGVPFVITSKSTGESHVVVSDENGMINTANDWNAHDHNTNAGTGSSDGVWFGINEAGTVAQVNNELCTLPYDTYTFEEQPCLANLGLSLVNFEVTISRDGVNLNLGTVDDAITPQAAISKTDMSTGEQIAGAELLLERKNDETGEWEEYEQTTTTEETWYVEVSNGKYRLTETLAPENYEVAESIEFEVYEGEVVTPVEMKDKPIAVPVEEEEEGFKLPKTLDSLAAHPAVLAGLGLVGLISLAAALSAAHKRALMRHNPPRGFWD